MGLSLAVLGEVWNGGCPYPMNLYGKALDVIAKGDGSGFVVIPGIVENPLGGRPPIGSTIWA